MRFQILPTYTHHCLSACPLPAGHCQSSVGPHICPFACAPPAGHCYSLVGPGQAGPRQHALCWQSHPPCHQRIVCRRSCPSVCLRAPSYVSSGFCLPSHFQGREGSPSMARRVLEIQCGASTHPLSRQHPQQPPSRGISPLPSRWQHSQRPVPA